MTDTPRPEISSEEMAAVVQVWSAVLRNWSVKSASYVGSVEVRNILFAEALSVAQADMTVDDIALLLRGMAAKIEQGGLGPPSIQ